MNANGYSYPYTIAIADRHALLAIADREPILHFWRDHGRAALLAIGDRADRVTVLFGGARISGAIPPDWLLPAIEIGELGRSERP